MDRSIAWIAAGWLSVIGLFLAFPEPLRASPSQPPDHSRATSAACAPSVIPLQGAPVQPTDVLLSGRQDVRLRRVDAFLVPDAQRFRFERFDPFIMSGVLDNGCAFRFRRAAEARASDNTEVEILGPIQSIDGDFATFRVPLQQPSWTPSFDGYQHVMSSAIYPGGSAYLGVWHRTSSQAGSLVAAYDDDREIAMILGTSTRSFDAVYSFFSVHQYMFTLVDMAEGSEPLYIATFERVPPVDCCRSRRRRR